MIKKEEEQLEDDMEHKYYFFVYTSQSGSSHGFGRCFVDVSCEKGSVPIINIRQVELDLSKANGFKAICISFVEISKDEYEVNKVVDIPDVEDVL